jgi:hypothetical protein
MGDLDEQYQSLLPLLLGQQQEPLSALQGVMGLRNGAMLPGINNNLNGLISSFNNAVGSGGGGGGGGGLGGIIGGALGLIGGLF